MIAADLWAKLMEKLTPAVQEWAEKNYTPKDSFRVRCFGYYDDSYKTETFTCPCGWQGGYDDGDFDDEGCGSEAMQCPKCEKLLATVSMTRPLPDNWRELEREKELGILHQLPDIDLPEFRLVWDIEWEGPQGKEKGTWVVKLADRVIYSTWVGYEDYPDFVRVAKVLKEKYGDRVKDLEPAYNGNKNLETFLWGDCFGAPGEVDEARKMLATPSPNPVEPSPATHNFSRSTWLSFNPGGDVELAAKIAAERGYKVVP